MGERCYKAFKKGLVCRDNWLVLNEDNISLTLVHKHTGTRKVILC